MNYTVNDDLPLYELTPMEYETLQKDHLYLVRLAIAWPLMIPVGLAFAYAMLLEYDKHKQDYYVALILGGLAITGWGLLLFCMLLYGACVSGKCGAAFCPCTYCGRMELENMWCEKHAKRL